MWVHDTSVHFVTSCTLKLTLSLWQMFTFFLLWSQTLAVVSTWVSGNVQRATTFVRIVLNFLCNFLGVLTHGRSQQSPSSIFKSSTYFSEGCTNSLEKEKTIWPQEGHIRNSKETYSHLWFSRGWGPHTHTHTPHTHPLDPPMCSFH